ncbi:MAG TPA: tRNA (adenosine(37)-N6)-dimethylallyltransferase MiaA [Chthoniobacterales bacterium]|jgi:tRNA dimethylallyltransferase|nr:tRNA (adenosine(37)-N6)-dimethylallyltransferase MiaA [Chthoniobacterales bacterium]
MKRVFFIVGPTAVGKSEIAAEVARQRDAEVVSADAYQIYRGLDLLTAKPDQATRAKATHHLIGTVPLSEEMNAEKFRAAAEKIIGTARSFIVVGGTGLYIKALTHGLDRLPGANQTLRAKLEGTTNEELFRGLSSLDSQAAAKIDRQNRRRLIRAVEVCLLTGQPFSNQRADWDHVSAAEGILLCRDRDDLYRRINERVDQMFEAGVVQEVRGTTNVGPTAEKTLGLREIRALIAGEISQAECIARIQQATRRYAKRQLTWFRRQTNFPSLNLSAHRPSEAIELISQNAARVLVRG